MWMLIKFWFIEHGNTTTYEWKYGEPPLKIEETPLNVVFEDENDANDNAVSNAFEFIECI